MRLSLTIFALSVAASSFAASVTEEVYARLGKDYYAKIDYPFAPGTERFVAWRDPAKTERSKRTDVLFRQLRDLPGRDRFVFSWTHPWPETSPEFRVMTENGPSPKAPDDSEFVYGLSRIAGCNPVMYFTDFYNVTGTWQAPQRYAETRASMLGMIRKAWRKYRAVPVFSWHLENPYVPAGWRDGKYGDAPYRFRRESPGYPPEHEHVMGEILGGKGEPCGSGRSDGTSGTTYATPRAWYDSRLDEIASFLKELKDEDGTPIPAVVRLFHECEDDWHWWGRSSASTRDYIMLFRYTVNRLREATGGGKDLLFAYSPDRYWKSVASADGAGDFLYRYPGDDVVDIVGYDDYSIGTGSDEEVAKRLTRTIELMRMVSAFAAAHGKACGLFETGVRGARDDAYDWIFAAMTAPGVEFGFVNTWGGEYTIPATKAGMECWKRFLARPEVITYGRDIRLIFYSAGDTVPAPETKTVRTDKIVFLGNSITMHAPSESIGWTGNWGMAASAGEKDYVHLVVQALTQPAASGIPAPTFKVLNIADFERQYATYAVEENLREVIEFKPDLLILAIGENVPDLTTPESETQFCESVDKLLKAFQKDGNPAIIVRSGFWPSSNKDACLERAAAGVGATFVDIGALAKDEANYARSERPIAHAGVAGHPGDRGMKAIADAIVGAIRELQTR